MTGWRRMPEKLNAAFQKLFNSSFPLSHIKHLPDLKILSTLISEERKVKVVQFVCLWLLPWHTKYFQCSVFSATFFSVCGRLLGVAVD
jgi:TorA maturation chaperone TorD